jgi:hypothetical protein
VRFVWLDFLFFVIQLPKDLAGEKDGIGTQKGIARLEDVVDVTGFKQGVLSGLPLPEEGHVRQQVVAPSEMIEMLDAASLAPVQKIAQPLRCAF